MAGILREIKIETHQRMEMVDVTADLEKAVAESGIKEGILLAGVLHTTAGMTVNENADPDVVRDLLMHLERMVPEQGGYRHAEGNSDAHIKAVLVGNSVTIPVSKGALVLGTWQGIYFCEFDGPRPRKIMARVMG